MKINKKFIDITMTDLAKTGVFDDTDLQSLTDRAENGDTKAVQEIFNNLDEGNKILKETFINQKMDKIQREYKIINPDFNLITTDYFNDNIESLSLVGDRTVEPGPEETQDKDKHWYIQGFITYLEFKKFPELYQKFKEKYKDYSTDEWDLELNVIGGIMVGNLALNREELEKWRKDGVLIEPWGFDENSSMISFTELLIQANEEFKKKANSIREKGRIDSMEDLKTLMLDDEGEELFKSIFNC